ncbi:MAG: tandem-95 repeat protein, partial [Candidatus Magnetomorum sp.]|nr:tandem-95 repeat protein [Candidatus Magnetomorum sp.]
FMVSDGELSTDIHSFAIVLTPVNDQPQVADMTVSEISEGQSFAPIHLDDFVEDVDNSDDEISWTFSGQVELSISINNRIATIAIPDENWNGTETINFTATDPDGLSSTDSVTFTVTPVNDSPKIVHNTGVSISEGGRITLTTDMIQASDIEDNNDLLIFTIKTLPQNGNILHDGTLVDTDNYTFPQSEIVDGNIHYQHDGTNTSIDSFGFIVQDNDNADTGYKTFRITIETINDKPTLTVIKGITVTESHSTTISLNDLFATDEETDADDLIYKIIDFTDKGTLYKAGVPLQLTFTGLDIRNNQITYGHDGGENDRDHFSFSISDNDPTPETIGPFDYTITVLPENDPPEITINQTLTVNESQSITITNNHLSATDNDSGDLSLLKFQLMLPPIHGQLLKNETILNLNALFTQTDINSGQIHYVHDGSETEYDHFFIVVKDKYSTSDTVGLTITVLPINDPPQVTDLNVSTSEDTPIDGQLTSNDPENDACTYSIVSQAAHGTVQMNNAASGTFTYTPDQNFNGTDQFTYQSSDTDGLLSNTANVVIQISPVNDPPSISFISNQTLFSVDGQSKPITLTLTDPDNLPEFLRLSIQSSNETLLPLSSFIFDGVGQTRHLIIVPAKDVIGQAMVTIKVTDDDNAMATKSFRVSVIYSDTEPPVISLSGDQLMILEKEAPFDEPGVSAMDNTDGDISERISIDDHQLNTQMPGTYQIKYTVSDQAGNSAKPVYRTIIVYEVEIPMVVAKGNVVDETGERLSGVTVSSRVSTYTVLTDDQGAFEYEPLTENGKIYRLTFSRNDYEPVTKKFSGTSPYDQDNLIDIELLSLTNETLIRLGGLCTEYQSITTSIADVLINVFNSDTKKLIAMTQTNENGIYTIAIDPVNLSMQLIVEAVKYGYATQKISIDSETATSLDFQMPKKTSLMVSLPVTREDHNEARNNQKVKMVVEADPPFDGSPNEFSTADLLETSFSLIYTATNKQYIIQHSGYTSFSIQLKADTTEDRDTQTGYVRTMTTHFTAIPQQVSYTATLQKEKTIK